MDTRSWVAVAPASKKKDALTIALPAAGGSAPSALLWTVRRARGSGRSSAAAPGTAAVLSTRGKDVRVGNGAVLRCDWRHR
jgi:hypothetical protein